MKDTFIANLIDSEFIHSVGFVGNPTYQIKAPCQFIISPEVVAEIKENYLPGEEIGGLFYAKPILESGKRVLTIEKVTFIRNACEDTPRTDGRTKANTYRFDTKQGNTKILEIFSEGSLPIKFHTHPTKQSSFVMSLQEQLRQAQTSEADRKESTVPFIWNDMQILTPRALIVGSELKSGDIIFGFYAGGVAPLDIKQSVEEVQKRNIQLLTDRMEEIELTDNAKIVIAIIFVILLIVTLKNPKAGTSLLILAGMTAQLYLSKTQHLKDVNYYSKIDSGEAKIIIP